MTISVAWRPCLTAFWLDIFLPASVLGPVDFWAFSRLASIFFSLVDIVVGLYIIVSKSILGGFDGEIVKRIDRIPPESWNNSK